MPKKNRRISVYYQSQHKKKKEVAPVPKKIRLINGEAFEVGLKTMNAVISPKGTFYICDHRTHEYLAERLFKALYGHNPGPIALGKLEQEGWLHLSNGNLIDFYLDEHKISQDQIDSLFDWSLVNGCNPGWLQRLMSLKEQYEFILTDPLKSNFGFENVRQELNATLQESKSIINENKTITINGENFKVGRDNTLNGLISPEGRFYICNEYDHFQLAKRIIKVLGLAKAHKFDCVDFLEALGWMHITHGRLVSFKPVNPTQAQIDTIFDWASKNFETNPVWVDNIISEGITLFVKNKDLDKLIQEENELLKEQYEFIINDNPSIWKVTLHGIKDMSFWDNEIIYSIEKMKIYINKFNPIKFEWNNKRRDDAEFYFYFDDENDAINCLEYLNIQFTCGIWSARKPHTIEVVESINENKSLQIKNEDFDKLIKEEYEFILSDNPPQETFTIKNRYNDSIIYETEAESLKDAVEQAVIERVSLRGANLDEANLNRADLREANLSYANLSYANLCEANLERAYLRRANLYGAHLERASLGWATLAGANLEGANLEGADLEGADLEGADLEGANLAGANLAEANLERAYLRRANLYGAHLERANLYGAHLERASLRWASLEGANLEGAIGLNMNENYEFISHNQLIIKNWYNNKVMYKLNDSTLKEGLERLIRKDKNLEGIDLRNQDLGGTNFKGAYLRGANFKGSDCNKANFEGAYLEGANFIRTNLSEANFKNAILISANMTQANLEGTYLNKSSLIGANFKDSIGLTLNEHVSINNMKKLVTEGIDVPKPAELDNNKFAIEDIKDNDDIIDALRVKAKIFVNDHYDIGSMISYTMGVVDWHISKKLTYDGKMVGCYLFNKESIVDHLGLYFKHTDRTGFKLYEDLMPYAEKKGLEGVTLAILPEFRGLGWGNKLKDVPKSMDVDYIWGQQFKTLGNLKNWLKRRRLVAETNGLYFTLQDLR